jgi:hypothetical protein
MKFLKILFSIVIDKKDFSFQQSKLNYNSPLKIATNATTDISKPTQQKEEKQIEEDIKDTKKK